MDTSSKRRDRLTPSESVKSEEGKVKVKFFGKASLIISIILSLIGTIILNMIL